MIDPRDAMLDARPDWSELEESLQITVGCQQCGEHFDIVCGGDIERLLCMTCILEDEDPDAIKK